MCDENYGKSDRGELAQKKAKSLNLFLKSHMRFFFGEAPNMFPTCLLLGLFCSKGRVACGCCVVVGCCCVCEVVDREKSGCLKEEIRARDEPGACVW